MCYTSGIYFQRCYQSIESEWGQSHEYPNISWHVDIFQPFDPHEVSARAIPDICCLLYYNLLIQLLSYV